MEHDTGQSALEQEAERLKEGITAQAEDGMKAQRLVFLVRRYTSFDELTAPMLSEFIEKVVVHEADNPPATADRRLIYISTLSGALSRLNRKLF